MNEPRASRPFMPGYGVPGPTEGSGLLPWGTAEERLSASRNYWIATVSAAGKPHVMPVWGTWDSQNQSFWFTSSVGSRKVRNLAVNPLCVVTTDDANDPVVLEGRAEIVTDIELIRTALTSSNLKYSTDYPIEFVDPAVNATLRVRPGVVFGCAHEDFSGSATRWTFAE